MSFIKYLPDNLIMRILQPTIDQVLNDLAVEIIQLDTKNIDHEQGHIDALNIIARMREELYEEVNK